MRAKTVLFAANKLKELNHHKELLDALEDAEHIDIIINGNSARGLRFRDISPDERDSLYDFLANRIDCLSHLIEAHGIDLSDD